MASTAPCVTLSNGQKMPLIGLGTYNAEPGQVEQTIKDAIDIGYRHFDCARFYKNEKQIGDGINAKLQEGVVKREDLYIVSKLWNTKHRPDLVVPECRKTLSDLGLVYIDLYLMHWPMGYKEDDSGKDNLLPFGEDGKFIPSDVDYVETWKAMEECVKLGLVKAIGLSNFNSDQISRIFMKGSIKPVVNQVELHPHLSQRMLEGLCKGRNIQVVAYSPLSSPALSWHPPGAPTLFQEPKLKALASKYKRTVGQIVLRWTTQRGIVAIPKTTNNARLAENISVFDFTLSDEDMNTIFSLDVDAGKGRRCVEQAATTHKYYPFHNEV